MFKSAIPTAVVLIFFYHCNSQGVKPLNLLPVPKSVALQSGSFNLNQTFTVAIHSPVKDTILVKAVNRMDQTIN